MNTPSTDVTPGMWGFVVFAILAVSLYFLMRNMNSRMRRMSYRQKDAGREVGDAQATETDATHTASEATPDGDDSR